MITKENFESLLKSVGAFRIKIDKYGFSRSFQLNVFDAILIFEWWSNLCKVYIGSIEIYGFTFIEIKNTWPNNYKTNLHLLKDNEIIAIIPIERYTGKS